MGCKNEDSGINMNFTIVIIIIVNKWVKNHRKKEWFYIRETSVFLEQTQWRYRGRESTLGLELWSFKVHLSSTSLLFLFCYLNQGKLAFLSQSCGWYSVHDLLCHPCLSLFYPEREFFLSFSSPLLSVRGGESDCLYVRGRKGWRLGHNHLRTRLYRPHYSFGP